MTLGAALQEAVAFLTANDVGSPRLNAEILLMFVLECDRAYLYAHPERELSPDEAARYATAQGERARGVPAQYIVGHQEFWGLDFLVTPAVLIPRPETEHVIEAMLHLAAGRDSFCVVDVGTGSGCIALALGKEFPEAEISACDISAEALEVARANAARLQFEGRVRFVQSDLLEGFGDAEFEFVVSNPPYVGESEADKVQREVRKFEPHVAVFGGAEGMDIYRRLIPEAKRVLKPGGWLVMEIGFSIEAAIRKLLAEWSEVRINPDLQGIPRVALARK